MSKLLCLISFCVNILVIYGLNHINYHNIDGRVEVILRSNTKELLSYLTSNHKTVKKCETNPSDGECYELNQNEKLVLQEKAVKFNNETIDCETIIWSNSPDKEEICFDLGHDQWFGGGTHSALNIKKASTRARSPYTGYDGSHKSVLEPYWFSSSGTAIFVDRSTPLFLRFDNKQNGSLCFSASYDEYPYNSNKIKPSPKYLKVDVCEASNIKQISMFAINNWLGKPTAIPDQRMMTQPIWSTWAQFHSAITEAKVLKFANDINGHNFTNSQIEIDDNWETCYGDLDFNKSKFSNPKKMVDELSELGFRTTLWVHPFVNPSCNKTFEEGVKNGYFIKSNHSDEPVMKDWWHGSAAHIDFTNPSAQEWYAKKLQHLKTSYGIFSFKFDAGEIHWVGEGFKLFNQTLQQLNPNYLSSSYAETVYKAVGNDLEVRVGYHSQHVPVFVRLLDKSTDWDYDNGLKSLIPETLLYSLYGYPYVLPDMIGGNQYGGKVADKELFIRWVQTNTFLPCIQFSIIPWNFDSETLELSQKFVKLHESYANKYLQLSQRSVSTGEPIVRPLWWADPKDNNTISIDTQFLFGDDVMVAPIVEKGAVQRDIYIPTGHWTDHLSKVFIGPKLIKNYSAPIDVLPYFIKTL